MFYIHILNQPANRESNSEIPDSTLPIDRNSLIRHHQRQSKKYTEESEEITI
jgi:hypothetical protein